MSTVAFSRPAAARPSIARPNVARPAVARSAASRPLVAGPAAGAPTAPTASTASTFARRRFRVIVGVCACAIVAVLAASNTFADAQAPSSATGSSSGTVVIVQPGDTMWSLARSLQPTGDVRPLVAQLSRAHGGASLQAGERIVLPAAA